MLNNVHVIFKSTFSKSSLLASLLLMTALLLMVTLLLLMFMLLLSSMLLLLSMLFAGIHAVEGVSSVVGHIVTGTFALALALVHAVTGTKDAVIRVAAVVGSTVAVVSCCCRNVWLLLILLRSRKVFQSRRKTFYIPQCRKSLPVSGLGLFTFSHAGKLWSLNREPV
jgi:hypothetical protein